MTTIELRCEIKATRDVCFDLSRSIEVHKLSTATSHEQAVGGCTKGLIEEGEWVKWKAKHFFIPQTLTVQIREMKEFRYFVDEMIDGPFKSMKHEHRFEAEHGKTIMSDKLEYEVPFGIVGKLFDKLILKSYMTDLLKKRNETI
ncbi:MAG TPA: SRPBCC family protein, partial [Chryseosolibacter sp.]